MDSLQNRFNKIIKKTHDPSIENTYYNFQSTTGPENPEWLAGKVLYEIYIRSFTAEGTFDSAIERLPSLKNSGIDFIWLMPIFPIGEKSRKGHLGSPYSVYNYYEINPEYGTKESFRKFVRSAHNLGMKVIIDMVANHVACDYQAAEKEAELILRDSKGQPQRKCAEWTDIYDLDYNYPETREHVLNIMHYLLKEFNLDGFRCDVAGMVPLDFWEKTSKELRKINPELYMLAESDGPYLHKKAFNSTYDWVMYELMKDVKNGVESASILLEWLHVRMQSYPKNTLTLRFLENHDLPRAVAVFGEKGIIPFITFLFTVDGLPLLYNGQEIGDKNFLSHFNKDEINWELKNQSIEDLYLKLIELRKLYKAMSSASLIEHHYNDKKNILLYEKGDENKIYVLLNFKNSTEQISLKPDDLNTVIKSAEILFNSQTNFEIGKNEIKLNAYQAIILREIPV